MRVGECAGLLWRCAGALDRRALGRRAGAGAGRRRGGADVAGRGRLRVPVPVPVRPATDPLLLVPPGRKGSTGEHGASGGAGGRGGAGGGGHPVPMWRPTCCPRAVIAQPPLPRPPPSAPRALVAPFPPARLGRRAGRPAAGSVRCRRAATPRRGGDSPRGGPLPRAGPARLPKSTRPRARVLGLAGHCERRAEPRSLYPRGPGPP